MRYYFLIVFFGIAVLFPDVGLAQTAPDFSDVQSGGSSTAPAAANTNTKKSPIVFDPEIAIPFFPTGPVDGTTFAQYIRAIFVVFIWSVGVLATVMVIYGGVRWVAAAGDASRINQAKDVIYNAIIGLVIALTSVLLLNLIDPRLVRFEGLTATQSEQVVGIPFETDLVLGQFNEAGEERPDPVDPTKTVGGCKTSRSRTPIARESTCSVGPKMIWPVQNVTKQITSRVGPRNISPGSTCHPGTDISTGKVDGKNIVAPMAGKVTGVASGLGEYIVTLQGDGFYLRFVHIKQPKVSLNQQVQAGTLLGISGGDPNDSATIKKFSGGPHLHLELYLNNGDLRDVAPCLQV